MPTQVNNFYAVYLPMFSINSTGTQITARFPIRLFRWTRAGDAEFSIVRYLRLGDEPALGQGESSWMASRYDLTSRNDSDYITEMFLCDFTGGQDWSGISPDIYPAGDAVQLGYALYSPTSVSGRPTTGFTQFAEVPVKKLD